MVSNNFVKYKLVTQELSNIYVLKSFCSKLYEYFLIIFLISTQVKTSCLLLKYIGLIAGPENILLVILAYNMKTVKLFTLPM